MAKLDSILEKRLKPASEASSKMAELAQRSTAGNLNSFAGLFSLSQITPIEQEQLRLLLQRYVVDTVYDIEKDLQMLSKITSEVKAINNQAALLHGERIKNAQLILKNYKEGGFTAWLLETYGNRQTPYNFLQYYELHLLMPRELHVTMERMPRQVLYTLASRSGEPQKKQRIIQDYTGQTKQELLEQIRQEFPLHEHDQRQQDLAGGILRQLQHVVQQLQRRPIILSSMQQRQFQSLLKSIHDAII